jgi:hypothetical protein
LVTGGTGFIGQELVRKLVARGDDVVLFSRKAAPAREHVETVAWTPEQEGPWTEVVRRVDAIIHLAGQGIMERRWSPEFLESCRRSRVVPTGLLAKHLAASAREGGPCKVWVSASAVGIYGFDTHDREIDESAPLADDVLAQMCKEWEAATQPAADAGVRVCHARIGIVLGPNGGALAKMLPAYKAFVGGPIGDGKQYFAWIHLADAVGALLYATQEESMQGAFNLVAPGVVTAGEFATTLGKVLGRPSFFRVPGFALKVAFGEQSQVLLGGQRAVPRKLERFPFVFPTLEPALRDIVSG